MDMHNPLTDEHCQCANKVLQQTPAYLQLADACIDCGWDFGQQFKDRLLQQQSMAEAIKRNFFRNRP